jgi:hypothetical protein
MLCFYTDTPYTQCSRLLTQILRRRVVVNVVHQLTGRLMVPQSGYLGHPLRQSCQVRAQQRKLELDFLLVLMGAFVRHVWHLNVEFAGTGL